MEVFESIANKLIYESTILTYHQFIVQLENYDGVEPNKLEHIILYKWLKNDKKYLTYLNTCLDTDDPTNILNVILTPDTVDEQLWEFIEKNINSIMMKKCYFTDDSFRRILTKINFNEDMIDNLFIWFCKSCNGDEFLWYLIKLNDLKTYFKLEKLSSTFDPSSMIKGKLSTYSKIENMESFVSSMMNDEISYNDNVLWNLGKRDSSLEEKVKFIQMIKRSYLNYCHSELIYEGAINDYWDELLDTINRLIHVNPARRFSSIVTCILWGNTKLIDHFIETFPEQENQIKYNILIIGHIDIVKYYFPDLSKESVNLLLEKLID